MRPIEFVHKGVNPRVGLIIDTGTLGLQEAQRRVLDQWVPGVRTVELPTGHWLVLFDEKEDVDSTAVLGTPVVKTNSGLAAAPQLTPGHDEVAWWVGGIQHSATLASLPTVDPRTWINVGVSVDVLEQLPAAELGPASELAPPPPEVDLRAAARIGGLSPQARRFAAGLNSEADRGSRQRRRKGQAGRRVGQAGQRNGSPLTRAAGSLAAKAALRSPLRNQIGRHHQRYLNRLTEQFQAGQLDEAIRKALPINGLTGSALTLRLPKRREGLQLTGGSSGGGSVPLGGTVHLHLKRLYADAAKQLEAEGKIDEAAFVLSELMNSPTECVALLERHGRFGVAATLAENRRLEPEITVRLWWLAGDRDRAMRLARKTQIYGSVVTRLAESDPESAHEFRLLWVDQLERSGDLFGAMAAGWPDVRIRPLLVGVVARGSSLDDDNSLSFQVYRLALTPSDSNKSLFLNALGSETTSPKALRILMQSLVDIDSIEPALDREICTAVVRRLLVVPRRSKDRSFVRTFKALAQRADPVMRSDLPGLINPSDPSEAVTLPAIRPGPVRPLDVVPLGGGRILVALGERGVKLLTAGGKTAARWPTPCHHLVAADHGNTVILLTERTPVLEAHVLDLATQKLRHYGTLQSSLWAKSFDGTSWAVVDQRGIVFFDMLADRPTITWRELEPGWSCYAIQRSEGQLAAVVTAPASAMYPDVRTMLWRWNLPDMRLQQRHRFEPPERAVAIHLVADAASVWERPDASPVVLDARGSSLPVSAATSASIHASGNFVGLRNSTGDLTISRSVMEPVLIQWSEVEDDWNLRSHGERVAVWTAAGKIAIVNSVERSIDATVTLSDG